MVDLGVLVAFGSLLVAAIAVFLNVRKAFVDKRLAARANLEREYRAPVERDAIIVNTASEAVAVLKLTLTDTRDENQRLRKRIDEQDKLIADQGKRIRHLERELAKLTYEGKEAI